MCRRLFRSKSQQLKEGVRVMREGLPGEKKKLDIV